VGRYLDHYGNSPIMASDVTFFKYNAHLLKVIIVPGELSTTLEWLCELEDLIDPALFYCRIMAFQKETVFWAKMTPLPEFSIWNLQIFVGSSNFYF